MTGWIQRTTLAVGRLGVTAALRGRFIRVQQDTADQPPPDGGPVPARRHQARSLLIGALITPGMLVSGVGCAGGGASPVAPASAAPAPAPSSQSSAALPCVRAAQFDRSNFPPAAEIDNEWLPMVPGTRLTFEGRANRGGGALPHRVVFSVTDLTKLIDGVRTRVIWEQDINEGELVESELAFFAQDEEGNVWAMGEYPEEYESGKFVGAPSSWIPGQSGAEAAVAMLAKPKVGTSRYLQGHAPAVDFLDCAQVHRMGERVCPPISCYNNVLVTDENSPLDPGSGHQRKYYAAGVGNVQVSPLNDPEDETLVLIKVERLASKALQAAADSAFKLEKRAYRVSDVYRHTQPIQR
jgi:hypothetical protein